MTFLAVSGDTYWAIALIIGLVAALVVVVLLALLLQNIARALKSQGRIGIIKGRRHPVLHPFHCVSGPQRSSAPVSARQRSSALVSAGA